MPLEKSPNRWNYKTLNLRSMQGPDFVEQLGNLLDEAGRNGWELCYMSDEYMIMKQLYIQTDD